MKSTITTNTTVTAQKMLLDAKSQNQPRECMIGEVTTGGEYPYDEKTGELEAVVGRERGGAEDLQTGRRNDDVVEALESRDAQDKSHIQH